MYLSLCGDRGRMGSTLGWRVPVCAVELRRRHLTRRLFCVHPQAGPDLMQALMRADRLRLVEMPMGSTDFLKTTGFAAKKANFSFR